MNVPEYQIAIFLSILIVGLLSQFAMWIVVLGWSAWTISEVNTNPLLTLQFATIVCACVAAAKIRAGRSAPPAKVVPQPAQVVAEKKASTQWAGNLGGIAVVAYFGWSHFFAQPPTTPSPVAVPTSTAKPVIAQAPPAPASPVAQPSSDSVNARPLKRRTPASKPAADLRSCLALRSDAAMARCAASVD